MTIFTKNESFDFVEQKMQNGDLSEYYKSIYQNGDTISINFSDFLSNHQSNELGYRQYILFKESIDYIISLGVSIETRETAVNPFVFGPEYFEFYITGGSSANSVVDIIYIDEEAPKNSSNIRKSNIFIRSDDLLLSGANFDECLHELMHVLGGRHTGDYNGNDVYDSDIVSFF